MTQEMSCILEKKYLEENCLEKNHLEQKHLEQKYLEKKYLEQNQNYPHHLADYPVPAPSSFAAYSYSFSH